MQNYFLFVRATSRSRYIKFIYSYSTHVFIQIIIEAVRGAHYTSDVAIDNIRVVPGLCEKEAEGNLINSRTTVDLSQCKLKNR